MDYGISSDIKRLYDQILILQNDILKIKNKISEIKNSNEEKINDLKKEISDLKILINTRIEDINNMFNQLSAKNSDFMNNSDYSNIHLHKLYKQLIELYISYMADFDNRVFLQIKLNEETEKNLSIQKPYYSFDVKLDRTIESIVSSYINSTYFSEEELENILYVSDSKDYIIIMSNSGSIYKIDKTAKSVSILWNATKDLASDTSFNCIQTMCEVKKSIVENNFVYALINLFDYSADSNCEKKSLFLLKINVENNEVNALKLLNPSAKYEKFLNKMLEPDNVFLTSSSVVVTKRQYETEYSNSNRYDLTIEIFNKNNLSLTSSITKSDIKYYNFELFDNGYLICKNDVNNLVLINLNNF